MPQGNCILQVCIGNGFVQSKGAQYLGSFAFNKFVSQKPWYETIKTSTYGEDIALDFELLNTPSGYGGIYYFQTAGTLTTINVSVDFTMPAGYTFYHTD